METATLLITVLIILVFVLSITLLIIKLKQKNSLVLISAQSSRDAEDVALLEGKVKELEEDKSNLNAELQTATMDLMQAKTRLESQLNKDDLLKQQEKTFENLAHKILETQSKKLKEESKESLSPLLNPLKQNLENFSKRMDTFNESNIKGQTALSEQLKHLKEQSLKISEDATNLTKALKGDNKAQGDWGEMVLEELLESSGLRKGEEYITQKAQEGGQKPDVVINLPDKKHIIVDSKVSLVAWANYTEAETEEEREIAMKAHKKSLRDHVKGLSEKEYEKIESLHSPDFVLMFVPLEGALLAGLREDKKLFMDAFKKNIVIVSPSTLMPTLRTIHNIWQSEKQNQNAQKISDQAVKMLKKFQSFTDDLDGVGKHLDKATDSYQDAVKKLSTGKDNTIRQAEKMQELGIKMDKKFPKRFQEDLLEEDSTQE